MKGQQTVIVLIYCFTLIGQCYFSLLSAITYHWPILYFKLVDFNMRALSGYSFKEKHFQDISILY